MDIVQVRDDAGEWQALYVNGKCTTQDHNIELYDFIMYLKQIGIVKSYKSVEGTTEDYFPEDLGDVKLVE